MDKEENSTVSETINDSIINNTEESESNQEDEKWNGKGPIILRTWRLFTFQADVKKACEEGVKRAMDKLKNNNSIEESVRRAMKEYQNINGIEEGLDDEENDGIEEVKKWAVIQKQSLISN